MKKLSIKEWLQINYGKKSELKPRTIERKCRRGEIPNAIKEGRRWVIQVEEKNYEHR
jgi:hypothetical protein